MVMYFANHLKYQFLLLAEHFKVIESGFPMPKDRLELLDNPKYQAFIRQQLAIGIKQHCRIIDCSKDLLEMFAIPMFFLIILGITLAVCLAFVFLIVRQ